MSGNSTAVPAGSAVLDDENLSESFPGPCAPLTRDVILRIYPPLARGLARTLALPEPASPVVFHEGRAYYSVSSLSALLLAGPRPARHLLPASRIPSRLPIRTLWSAVSVLYPALLETEEREVRFLRDLDLFLRNERGRFGADSEWQELRDSLVPLIDGTRSRFEPVLHADILALFLGDLYRWIGREPPLRTDPVTASCMRSLRHLRSAVAQDGTARDYLLSCAGTGHYSPAMLRLRNDEIAHLLNDFLEEFGDRCPGELKLETRSYREYPELFLPFLLDESSNPPGIAKKKDGSGRGPLRWLDRKFASLISFRQGARWMRAGAFGVLRARLLRMGALLEEKGAIESKEDVFFFQLGELLAMDSPSGNHRDLIMDRRVIHYDQGELRVRGRLKPGQNGEWLADPGAPADPVRTTGPSIGTLEGEVLMIPSEDRLPSSPDLLRGKILVLHAAGPGIVHHLRWVGGLISETGSALSHASILCREFGVPSIFGVKGAMEHLHNGQQIRWNPETGVIESIDSPK